MAYIKNANNARFNRAEVWVSNTVNPGEVVLGTDADKTNSRISSSRHGIQRGSAA